MLAHGRGVVARVSLKRPHPVAGAGFVVKLRDDAELAGYAETNLATEAAALSVLQSTGTEVAPRILAGGPDEGFLILSDEGRSVESLLFADDLDAAMAALLELARTLARLHRVEVGPEAFAGLNTWTVVNREAPSVRAACLETSLPPPTPAAADEAEALAGELAAPSAGGFVHGDLTPNNAVVDPAGSCRLVDFEGAGYQHIGLDAAMLRFPFAWYGRWAPMAAEQQQEMERAYRAALGWEEARLDAAMATGCMAMALLRLERLPRIADPGQEPAMALRRRSQIVATVETAIGSARSAGRYPGLVDWLADLVREMRGRWPEANETLPAYPAFRGAQPG